MININGNQRRFHPLASIKRLSILTSASLLLLISLAGCSGNANTAVATVPALLEPVGAQLEAAAVERGTVETSIIYHGSVIPETIDLSFDVDGRVKEVNRFIGRDVKAGDVLIEIESISQGEIESKEEELENLKDAWAHEEKILTWQVDLAELELRRLVDEGLSPSEREYQALNVRERKLTLSQARGRYTLRASQIERKLQDIRVEPERLLLRAPIDGKILYLPAFAEGDTIQAFDTVAVLADEDSLLIRSSFVSDFYLSTAAAVTARIGDRNYDLLAHELDWELYMTLVMNDRSPHTYYDIDGFSADDLPSDIVAGLYVPVKVTTQQSTDTLRIPVNCLYRDGKQRYVYVIEDGDRVRRDIEVGLANAAWTEVTAGLEEGEQVYIHD